VAETSDAPERTSFLDRYLEPADRLNEVLFGLIMVLTFTLTAGFAVGDGSEAARELFLATLGCNVAWGLIDGGMFLMGSLLERARNANALGAVRRAPDDAAALAAVERALEGTLASYASPAERESVARVVLGVVRRIPAARVRIRREDLLGAAASCALVVLSTVPAAIPFFFIQQPWRALRVSNGVLLAMLFVVGYRWGVHAQARPFVAGLVFLVLGSVMVGTAIALGG
jgi:hypothetical protein